MADYLDSDEDEGGGDLDKRIFDTALAVRSARQITEHLQSVEHVQRMATEQAKGHIAEMRDDILANQSTAIERQIGLVQELVTSQQTFMEGILKEQRQLVGRVVELLDFFRKQQAGATKPESKPPKRATIKHSDGTQSTIEFNGSGRF